MRKQMRRSFSVRLGYYERVKRYCDEQKSSQSGFIERLIDEFFRGAEEPEQKDREAPEEQEEPEQKEESAAEADPNWRGSQF